MDALFELFSTELVVVELLLLVGLTMLFIPILRAQLMRMQFVLRCRVPVDSSQTSEVARDAVGLSTDEVAAAGLAADGIAAGDQGSVAVPQEKPLPASAGDGTKQLYPVKYLAGHHSHSLLRLVPWDASGTLEASEHELHFVGSSPLGYPYDLSFDPDQALVNYQRGSLLWDGGITWCVIEVDDEKHYFSSEIPTRTAEEEFSAPNSTDALYRSLTNRYIKSSGS